MRTPLVLLGLIAGSAAGVAQAQTPPAPSTPAQAAAPASHPAEREPVVSSDRRLRTVRFDAGRVVTLSGRMGVQSMITFRSDERIENVAVGDSSVWQVTPNRRADVLFVKPLVPAGRTNMTVITTRRTYMFDLVAERRGEPTYALSFSYAEPPIVDPPVGEAALAAAAPEPTTTGAPVAAAPPAAPIALNFAWRTEGEARLFPQQVFDDGHATYLRWQPGVTLPAILTPSSEGGETPVNYAVVNDYVTVDGTPPFIVLRVGNARAILTRQAPAPATAAQTAER